MIWKSTIAGLTLSLRGITIGQTSGASMNNYSRDALLNFTDLLANKGLAKGNTAAALKTAASKILSDLSADEESDVRKVDIPLAVRRFNNKNPNALSPASLAQYQRRVANVIGEFVRYVDNPTSYAGIGGRTPKVGKADNGERPLPPAKRQTASDASGQDGPSASPTSGSSGLTLAFPLRGDFLAQVVLPRDLKSDEARRLAAFIATLAVDFAPD
jgi:hypothetical protein